ncbi:glycerol-3-phosphate responsive antiterminator [Macrococcus sp. EM39E]|uniref:glycerol-3-phosphate responsive antiterminator n=1 Tax=Macrococcus animalis TaxID=3395467 RepID=UPI0039BDE93D
MKDLETFLETQYEYCVILDLHISQIESILDMLIAYDKRAFFHVDLIKGLAIDESAVEFLIQKYKVFGIVTTRPKLIKRAKMLGAQTILRTFIIDSCALLKTYRFIEACEPDYVEVLPGIATKVVKELSDNTQRKIIAGGLIDTVEEAEKAFNNGATHVTTSNKVLWKYYNPEK